MAPAHAFKENAVMPFGVGIAQSAVGIFEPKLTIDSYLNDTQNAQTIFNMLSLAQGGSAAPVDIEYLIAAGLGQNAPMVVGDACWLGGFTIGTIKPAIDVQGVLTMNGVFAPRGRQTPPGRCIAKYTGADNAVPSTIFDHGANSAGLAFGGGFMTHILTPTGTAATGSITVPTQPVANDTVVINGVTFTFKASATVAGDVKIGATALASAMNLAASLYGSVTYLAAGNYVAVTAANQALLNVATYSLPTGGSNTITITYKTTGTGGNAFTLTRSGTGGLTVSGATLIGGVAGDALTIALQTATTSGGSYTTRATSSQNGQVVGADYQAIPVGTIIDEFAKVVVTGGAGQQVSLFCAFGAYYSQ